MKDIDAFLKQESTSFVNPEKISVQKEKAAADISTVPEQAEKTKDTEHVSKEVIISELQALASEEGDDFRTSFYDIIRATLESLNRSTSEDKMLINTLLYLNDKANWKDNIKTYWQKK